MKRAYKRRKKDFTKKILKRIYTTRKDLLEEEYKWLSLIKKEELGKRYYNVRNHHFNHWSVSDREKIRKTISEKTKEAMYRPDVREKYLESLKIRKNNHSPEVREKRRQSLIGKNKGKDTSKAVEAARKKNIGRKLTEEHKNKVVAALHKKHVCDCCGKEFNAGNYAKHKKI